MTPPKPGPRNDLTDVAGLWVGHATDEDAGSGVTVVRCAGLTPAAVDVRGGGPATRETDVLTAGNLVGGVHALSFSGGSVFGLAAADGVARALAEDGVGLRLAADAPAIPIVPSACIYDFGAQSVETRRDGAAPDYAALGRAALAAAADQSISLGAIALGAVGAGRGARAGAYRGGVGSASLDLGDGRIVAALIVANPVGSPLTPDGRAFWAWPWEIDGEFGGGRPDPTAEPAVTPLPPDSKLAAASGAPSINTAIGVVATTVDLTAAECRRVAVMAQDGLARAVRPAHTSFDGDTIFALAAGGVGVEGDATVRAREATRLGAAAADCVARAVARGVFSARRRDPLPGDRLSDVL